MIFRFDLSVPSTVLFLALTCIDVLITLGGMLWRQRIMHPANQKEQVVVARSPWLLIGAGVITGAATLICALTPDNNPGQAGFTAFNEAVLVAIVGGVVLVVGITYALRIWIGSDQGLTHYFLMIVQTNIPWASVDWVYVKRMTTQIRYYGFINGRKSVREMVVVEAGPKFKIEIPLDKPGISNRLRGSGPLIQMVERHATNALVGFQMEAFVMQRRMAATRVPVR